MSALIGKTFVAGLLLSVALCGQAGAEESAPTTQGAPSQARWEELRPVLFAGKDLGDGKGVIELHAPSRAVEAAVVPVSVHVGFPQSPERYIKAVSLVIDENPAPLAAVFHFTPDSGQADFETRVRLNDYSFIHAVAETNDGKFYVTSTYIKAAGGCSAPMSKDAEAAAKHLGQMKFQQIGTFQPGKPNLAQLMINHPNNSGMQMDQVTHLYIPAHYIQTVAVTVGDKPVLTIDADISLSQNPFFRFYFVPEGPAPLKVSVKDSTDRNFTADWTLGPQKTAEKTD